MPGVRKVRMAIGSKGKGKSSGARVITYDALVADVDDGTLVLVAIYDKSEQVSIEKRLTSRIASRGRLDIVP